MEHAPAAPIARHRAYRAPIRHHCSVALAQDAGDGRIDFPITGAVVTKNVPDCALMVGNPAKQTGWMCACGVKLHVAKGHGVCRTCGVRYRITQAHGCRAVEGEQLHGGTKR